MYPTYLALALPCLPLQEEEFDGEQPVVCELSDQRRSSWDDDFVLKRQFCALVPAFDPRPGRTNVNQTQDFDVPPPGEQEEMECSPIDSDSSEPRICLSIRGPSFPGVSTL